MGNQPLRWERTGVVIEVKPFNQYVVRLDGSGRVTLRNRKHLRKFTPFITTRDIQTFQIPQQPITASKPSKSATPALFGPPTMPPRESTISEVSKEPSVTPQQPVAPEDHPPQNEALDDNSTQPGNDHDKTGAPPPQEKKLPLAFRRLLAHNKSGRKE